MLLKWLTGCYFNSVASLPCEIAIADFPHVPPYIQKVLFHGSQSAGKQVPHTHNFK